MKLLCEINTEKQQNEIMPKVCQRRDMAVGKVLAHKHEDPGLTPTVTGKLVGMGMHICNSSLRQQRAAVSLGLASQLAYLAGK